MVELIKVGSLKRVDTFFRQCASADAVNRPFVLQLPVIVYNGVFHSVGVEG